MPSDASADLTLIGGAAFRPFRNIWMLEELGVGYRHVSATPRSPEATSANPFGKIPALVDGSFTMYESAAINTYLGDKFRGREGVKDLVPAPGTTTRGRYEQYVFCCMAELDAQGLWIHRKHEALGQFFGAIPDAVAHAKSHVEQVIRVISADLAAGGPYLCGEDFSAADILFVHCLNWAETIGWATWQAETDGGHSSALRAYLERCRTRPAYLAAKAKQTDANL
eukprot:gnl/TRDRNA2_/TRDRNA2_200345_c0_seq1.p1 gnl/TRDRNA2_/TRDRNA2_200345_c0~~gnl/TRDRNA2_/TRDRNA2_200345_c0_seq1.p1  ORF type:complete len:225 (+),score=31.17 gnl/TRDRNA2_/TRDRNA2_200345_c0_seq1:75-749(+)